MLISLVGTLTQARMGVGRVINITSPFNFNKLVSDLDIHANTPES